MMGCVIVRGDFAKGKKRVVILEMWLDDLFGGAFAGLSLSLHAEVTKINTGDKCLSLLLLLTLWPEIYLWLKKCSNSNQMSLEFN